MGEDVDRTEFSRQDRQQYREKVRRCLDVFARMLTESKFDFERPLTGLEIEFNLVDDEQNPAMRNADVLNAIASDDFQTELGQFNIEINVKPRGLSGSSLAELELELRASLNDADERSRALGTHIVMIGMLPTLAREHLTRESFSANPRYAVINEQIFAARGEDLHIAIDGPERLSTYADTIAPEAACTSVQYHLQVSPVPGRHPARARCQLTVLLRQGAVARDPNRAVRAGHRHPPGRAEGAGRAAAGVVRRALDHLDLRPVRRERDLLPSAAADLRDGGSGRGAGARRHAAARRAANAQRHHLPLEPADL